MLIYDTFLLYNPNSFPHTGAHVFGYESMTTGMGTQYIVGIGVYVYKWEDKRHDPSNTVRNEHILEFHKRRCVHPHTGLGCIGC